MKSANNLQLKLVRDLQSIPAEQIKRSILHLLASENLEFIDWEQALSSEVALFQQWTKERRKTAS